MALRDTAAANGDPLIRILLLDDHEVVREGVSRLLEAQPDMRVVGSFRDGKAALRCAAQEQPDVAILDITMPHESGVEIARQLRAASPDTHVLILSMHSDPEYVRQALEAGALGYVVKDAAGRVLVEAVRAVHGGRRFLSDSVSREALQRYQPSSAEDDPLARLSARERQVLQLVVEGASNAAIAARLGLSPKSVETYRSRMMAKLEIEDLPTLVKFAIRSGITTIG